MNNKKDLVISAIANYTPDKIKLYVESLSQSGFDGDKIMICYNLPHQTIEYLILNGWECYDTELSGHPHMKRLIDIWWFLENDERKWNRIFTSDVRDIIFQTNPFTWLDMHLEKPILVVSECVTYGNEPWGKKNIHEGYGSIFWNWIEDSVIGNVGTIVGEYDAIKDLLMLNWLVSQAGNTQHFTDQSSLNLVIHNNLIKDKIQLDTNFCFLGGTLNNTNRIENKNLTITNNNLMNSMGDVFPLIHQYDRIPELTKLIVNKYKNA
jgi:hypothetical protein